MSGLTPTAPAPAADGGGLAVVAFSGRTELWWLRILRPGFRHCLVLIRAASGWIVCDPMAHRTDIGMLPSVGADGADILAWLAGQGFLVVPVRLRDVPRRPAPWAPFTCVEAVKRILGIRARRVLTPWQLYNHLVMRENMLDITAL